MPDADPLSVQCLDALPFVHADHLFFLPLSGEILSQGGSVLFDDPGSILFYDLHLLPGVLFFLIAGKKEELDSPIGWATAIIVGLLCTIAMVIFFLFGDRFFFKRDFLQDAIGFLVADPSRVGMDKYTDYVVGIFNFEVGVYITSFFAGIIWRVAKFFPKQLGGFWLSLENKFCPNDSLFVSRRLLENFLFAASVAQVPPILRLLLKTGELVEGKCLKYRWIEPRTIMLLAKKDQKSSLLIVPLASIQAVYVVNWYDFKKAERKKAEDEWKYLRYIDPRLPELLLETDGKMENDEAH
ncbi:hypothetical protein [Neomoorella thermoacetica]|uniref:hypothetical protein n=1 Tax=Neomoorella thermoacetica TaxID=1525 RepID=UPI001E36115F|nr:hypothetical protein [Moorella thermoacetica]